MLVEDPEHYHASKEKYSAYMVYRGVKPSVYLTWEEARRQVSGIPGGLFEGFETITEACALFSQLALKGICRPLKCLPGAGLNVVELVDEGFNRGSLGEEDSGENSAYVSPILLEPTAIKEDKEEVADNKGAWDLDALSNNSMEEDGAEDGRYFVVVKGQEPGIYPTLGEALECLGCWREGEMHVSMFEHTANRIFVKNYMVLCSKLSRFKPLKR
ncbi:hypothetical protein P691DRAFT_780763 [Macrolepiota fuliginosa MF-IS2]|uniref:Ribonuclease H1 N-terminal domain-containing protein n=1 Tax=Macrolepiota fuliginosa MF-IS2 TaxID=1400762 RepID=A0A9P6BX02_9AGAR|nr:hypothetical protein P691DRAFT_780763 [Macrolepiota fuliginosa MF-IS2]